MTENIEALDSLNIANSGLDQILNDEEYQRLYIKNLGLFLTEKNQELSNFFKERPDLINNTKTKALVLINKLKLGERLAAMDISLLPKPVLADSYASKLIKLYADLRRNIIFEEINFYQFKNIMPSIVIYFSDYLLKEAYFNSTDDQKQEILDKVFMEITEPKNFESLHDEDLKAQQSRLLALYHRRQGNQGKALEHINNYRKAYIPDTKRPVELIKIQGKESYRKEDVLKNLGDIYQEVKDIQEEVLTRTGVYENTCFYFKCADCCQKDFPTVSLTEFLHIKNWLEEKNIDIKKFIANAKKIQSEHQELYESKLEVVDQLASSKQDENIHGHQFACPFLGEDFACSIHEARPLACRSFGLATIDDKSVQACKFYLTQYQYNSSHENEREVYDSRITTALLGGSNNHLAKEHGMRHKQPVATLVAWLEYFND